MKDIFIDNNIAKNFLPPVNESYKKFIAWLFEEGSLVVSKKLLNEYKQGLVHVSSLKEMETILGIIGKLTQEGRLNIISNQQLNNCSIPKRIENRLLSNWKDRDHLKTILLSFRKLAITSDNNFCIDINNHPKIDKIKPSAGLSPDEINYL